MKFTPLEGYSGDRTGLTKSQGNDSELLIYKYKKRKKKREREKATNVLL